MKKIAILSLNLISFATAANIGSVNFEGLNYLSDQVAMDISGIHPGMDANAENINEAIVRLFSQGYFEDVYVKQTGNALTFVVKEKPSISKIDIENVVTNDKDAIKGLIGIKAGQMYDEIAISRAKARIKQFYEVKGFFDTVVEEKVENLNDKKSSVHITLNINRGENIIIKKVNLIGAEKFDYGDFEPVIENKQRELLGWMWGFNDGKTKTFELPNDANKIREEYYKKGYLDASVSEPILKADMNDYSADITYYISEGNRYKVGKIDIQYPENVNLDKEKVIKNLKLQSGDKMNAAWLRKDMGTLEDLVADQGFAYVRILPKTRQDKENSIVDINYIVIPEEKVYIRNVTISGNDKTEDRVIRREMYLTEGNLYSKTDFIDSKNALKRTGYFDEVDIKETRVGADQIDLEVVVKEAPTGSITGGIGYGSNDGLLLSAGVSEKNIFGTGLQGSINVDKSDDALNGRISLTNPRVFDSKYSLGGMIFASDYDWDDYDEKDYGFSLTAGRKLGRYTNASLTYSFTKSKINGLDAFYKAAGYMDGDHTKSSIIPAISFNNTDDYFIPRSGIIAGASMEFAGLGGDIDYMKARGNFNWYYGLRDYIDWDLIFRYKANAGYMWNTDDDLPINEKLFLGGMKSIRGYSNRSVPKKRICLYGRGCELIGYGGLMSFNNSAELSFPLIERLKMRLIGFFDYGTIGDDSFTEEYRYSTGAGIEWMTPIGPLQLYFVKPLNEKDGDDTNSFEFSIGHSFN